MKNLIRWKFVIPTAIFLAGLIVFFALFFDPLLARALSSIGTRVNKAKVDVSGLHTKIFQGRLSIGNIQVTDPGATMKNMVEMGPLAFQLDFSGLIKKRVIIPEASLNGLKFHTDRKSDGKILFPSKEGRADQPSAVEKLTEKYKDQFKLNLSGVKAEAKGKIEFDPKTLALTKQSDELKAKADSLPDDWKQKINTLNVGDRLKNVEVELKAIENTPTKGTEALTAIPESLKKLKKAKSELDQIKSDLKTTRDNLTSDVNNLKSGIAGLQDAKNKDRDNLLSRLNLDFANPKHLIEGMVGGAIQDKIKTGLHYFQLARQYMPPKKEAEEPPKPRAGGMDIQFLAPSDPPRFWLKKAALSGEYEGVAGAGVITHLTSSPSRVGQPFTADFKGSQAAHQFNAKFIADHVTDISEDSLSVQIKNLNALNFLQGSALGSSLQNGSGNVDLALKLAKGDQLTGHIQMDLSQLKFNDAALFQQVGLDSSGSQKKDEQLKVSLMTNIARGMEKMAVSLGADVSGTWSDPHLKITSNLDELVKKSIKDSFGSLVEGQRKEIEDKLNAVLTSRKAELDQKTAGLQAKINDLLGGLDSQVQEKISKATKVNLGGEGEKSSLPVKIPSLDKFFKK